MSDEDYSPSVFFMEADLEREDIILRVAPEWE